MKKQNVNEMALTFGKNVQKRRKVKWPGKAQQWAANQFGISTQCLNGMEMGKHTPRMSTAQRIAEVLGCSVATLMKE
jgi:DNA-binding XRE family transcriptional regulator